MWYTNCSLSCTDFSLKAKRLSLRASFYMLAPFLPASSSTIFWSTSFSLAPSIIFENSSLYCELYRRFSNSSSGMREISLSKSSRPSSSSESSFARALISSSTSSCASSFLRSSYRKRRASRRQVSFASSLASLEVRCWVSRLSRGFFRAFFTFTLDPRSFSAPLSVLLWVWFERCESRESSNLKEACL